MDSNPSDSKSLSVEADRKILLCYKYKLAISINRKLPPFVRSHRRCHRERYIVVRNDEAVRGLLSVWKDRALTSMVVLTTNGNVVRL